MLPAVSIEKCTLIWNHLIAHAVLLPSHSLESKRVMAKAGKPLPNRPVPQSARMMDDDDRFKLFVVLFGLWIGVSAIGVAIASLV